MLPTSIRADDGCEWWNLACQGSEQVADAGLSVITRASAAGASQLMGEIVKVVDDSTQVPLTDPTYQRIYAGFLGLAAPIIGIVLLMAIIVATLRRDPGTLARAVTGIVVAGLGGAFYIVFAQLLVGIDNYLSHGVVEVTGKDLRDALIDLSDGFDHVAGPNGAVAANMLMITLILVMLFAGLMLWFLLVLRKIAILVVVAFAPLLIAGYLWEPTRPWVRRATEVLVALIFTKTAIYSIFGIGLALLARGSDQGISDLVGAAILVTGACFAPFMMLRLVHFAGNTHLAGDMFGTLRHGIDPVMSHIPTPGFSRNDMADHAGQAPPSQEQAGSETPLGVGDGGLSEQAAEGAVASGEGAAAGAGAAGAGGAAAAAGGAASMGAASAGVGAGGLVAEEAHAVVDSVAEKATDFSDSAMPGPSADSDDPGSERRDQEDDR